MNTKQNKINIAMSMAKDLNKFSHASELYVPILNDFKIDQHKKIESNCIFVAKNNKGFLEMFLTDGPLEPNETFENRINKILNSIKNELYNNNVIVDININHFKDYSNNGFNYKIYVQDTIVNSETGNKIIRQLNTYFIEPKYNDIYQLSLAYGPFKISEKTQTINKISKLEEDSIIKNLNIMLTTILKELNYNIKLM